MDLRELVGYFCAILAVAMAVGSLWAARYYSAPRQYRRMRARERREAAKRNATRQEAD
jgi:predicted histidine transporter YuiF (NhaC family)